MKDYLIRFAQTRQEFRLDELSAICDLFNVPFPKEEICKYKESSPFWIVKFPNDKAVTDILTRVILVREIVELLAFGDSIDKVIEKVKEQVATCSAYYEPFKESSFRFEIDDYMRKIEFKEQVELINKFSFLPLEGPVTMKGAQVTFSLHCDATTGDYYFGRLVGEGQRNLIDHFNLKKREYLGTTSMDSELSLVMCNLANVKPGSLVYDPFVGTGSFLCTSSFFGAKTLGSDIDGRQMRGGGGGGGDSKGLSIMSNLKQYNVSFRFVDGLVFDILQHPWRENFMVDTIITDPPYGVRAGAKKIGTKLSFPTSYSALLSPEEKSNRYPKTIPYEMKDLTLDLYNFALKFLAPGGRLVYWYPIDIQEDGSRLPKSKVLTMLPSVSGIRLLTIILERCRQFDRWLVVCEKQKEAV